MKSQQETKSFYQEVLAPKVEPLESYRANAARLVRRYLYISLACLSLQGTLFIIPEPLTALIAVIPVFVFLGMAYQKLIEMNKRLRYPFKYKVLLKAIGFLFEHYEYIANQRIAKHVLTKSLLFRRGIARVEGEDYMKYRIGDALMMFCETKVFGLRERMMFRGIFISSSFNKHFKSNTIILPKKPASFMHGLKKILFSQMRRVKLESLEFEKAFNVFSQDQIEARYIITPRLMELILAYKAKTKSEIALSFVDNRLYCTVPNFKNLFEAPFFKPIDYKSLMDALEPVLLYTSIVEDLNLNLKIWSKR